MEKRTVRYPNKGGAEKAAEVLNQLRKKEPSDHLVQIISEYGTPEPETKEPERRKDDRAAKDVEI
jgi:hypothetical protein